MAYTMKIGEAFEKSEVQDLLWTGAFDLAARRAELRLGAQRGEPRNRVGRLRPVGLSAQWVVDMVLESYPHLLSTWELTPRWFRDTCFYEIAKIIGVLENRVAEILEDAPYSIGPLLPFYWEAVSECFTVVREFLGEYVHSKAYQGGMSLKTLEKAVVLKAKAGDLLAHEYVRVHPHLPEHPGKPYWNGIEWTEYPAEIWEADIDYYLFQQTNSDWEFAWLILEGQDEYWAELSAWALAEQEAELG